MSSPKEDAIIRCKDLRLKNVAYIENPHCPRFSCGVMQYVTPEGWAVISSIGGYTTQVPCHYVYGEVEYKMLPHGEVYFDVTKDMREKMASYLDPLTEAEIDAKMNRGY